ncbi:MAG: hypothetical protein COA78_01240 [Blastopirellula sp.]|nr:MAG: hypothetical protein COA78_01240 [Blastopirellula sp.]
MNNNPRFQYLQTLLPAIVLITIGLMMFGEPYHKQAQRQLLLASVQNINFLSSDQFELQYEEEFVGHNDQTCHLFVFSKPSASDGQKEINRIVIADADYRLLISDDQMHDTQFSNAVLLLNVGKPVLEIVRHQEGTPVRILVDRFDVSSSGIQTTQRVGFVPLEPSEKSPRIHGRKRNKNRLFVRQLMKSYSRT